VIARCWTGWVDLWAAREHPRALAGVRILLGTVVFFDFLTMGLLDLVVPLMAPEIAGGIGQPAGAEYVPHLWRVLPQTAGSAWLVWSVLLTSSATLALGVLPRISALVFVLLSAQFALTLPGADRGIDTLVRNAALVLVASGAGETLSLGRRLRTGRWSAPDDTTIPAWPRYLLIVQLMVVYFAAGVSKVSSVWTPVGGWTALYIAMRDPHFQVAPSDWVDAAFPLTQALTGATWIWEWAGPSLVLAYWYRHTRDRGGWLRRTMNRVDYRLLYLAVGAFFHLGTHISFRLGMFPFAVMALYPAAFHPDELRRAGRWLRARLPGKAPG
jgi:hypothetical protein